MQKMNIVCLFSLVDQWLLFPLVGQWLLFSLRPCLQWHAATEKAVTAFSVELLDINEGLEITDPPLEIHRKMG